MLYLYNFLFICSCILVIGFNIIVGVFITKTIIPLMEFSYKKFKFLVNLFNSYIWNILFFKLSFINLTICILLGIFAKDYSTFISILGMFVGIELTLFFSLNIRTIWNKHSFYNHCVSMLGSDSLFLPRSYTHGLSKGSQYPKQIQDVLDNIGSIFADMNERNKPITVWTLKRIIDEKIYTKGIVEKMKCIDDLEYLDKCLCEAVDGIIKKNSFWFSQEYEIMCRDDLQNLLSCNYQKLTVRD